MGQIQVTTVYLRDHHALAVEMQADKVVGAGALEGIDKPGEVVTSYVVEPSRRPVSPQPPNADRGALNFRIILQFALFGIDWDVGEKLVRFVAEQTPVYVKLVVARVPPAGGPNLEYVSQTHRGEPPNPLLAERRRTRPAARPELLPVTAARSGPDC